MHHSEKVQDGLRGTRPVATRAPGGGGGSGPPRAVSGRAASGSRTRWRNRERLCESNPCFSSRRRDDFIPLRSLCPNARQMNNAARRHGGRRLLRPPTRGDGFVDTACGCQRRTHACISLRCASWVVCFRRSQGGCAPVARVDYKFL